MLQLSDVDTFYGPSQVLHSVSLEVNKGEIVCLLGANAAGKTTTMKTIFGLVRPRRGSVEFEGQAIERMLPGDISAYGIKEVPAGASSAAPIILTPAPETDAHPVVLTPTMPTSPADTSSGNYSTDTPATSKEESRS